MTARTLGDASADETGYWSRQVLRMLRRRAIAVRRPGATGLIAIDGRSGSGKSTLAAALVERLPRAALISLEDLYPGWDGLAAAPALFQRWVLAPLMAGRPARYRQYDWHAGHFADWIEVGQPVLLIVEGVGALDPRIRLRHQLRVWLQAPTSVRYARAIGRDGDLYRPHWDRWAAQERRYLDVVQPVRSADLVLRPR